MTSPPQSTSSSACLCAAGLALEGSLDNGVCVSREKFVEVEKIVYVNVTRQVPVVKEKIVVVNVTKQVPVDRIVFVNQTVAVERESRKDC